MGKSKQKKEAQLKKENEEIRNNYISWLWFAPGWETYSTDQLRRIIAIMCEGKKGKP